MYENSVGKRSASKRTVEHRVLVIMYLLISERKPYGRRTDAVKKPKNSSLYYNRTRITERTRDFVILFTNGSWRWRVPCPAKSHGSFALR